MGNKKRKNNNRKTTNKKVKRTKSSKETSLIRKKDVKLKFKYKHPKIALTLKIIFIIFLIIFVVGAGVAIGLFSKLTEEDFSIDIQELVLDDNSVIIDAEGNVLAELSGDENRKIITLDEMSPYLPKAYIAIEDERFETHSGVDIKGTGRAILSFVTHFGKSTAGGGSTITQQVVKNVTQDKDTKGLSGVIRKLKEWVKAYQIEKVMVKNDILELYLNLIFVGGKENRGVEIGSQYYFNKSAKDLSIAECAFLAGINHSPNAYNPYSGKEGVTEKIAKRTKTVLVKMKELQYINQEEYDGAIAEVEAGFKFENGAKGNVYSSHTDALISQIIAQIMEEKQISKNAAETYLYSSGLKIYSTQVSSVQSVMEDVAKKDKYRVESATTKGKANVDPIYAQTAMVVIDPSTGYVVGCIGQLGEKTTSRGQNRATQSTRSTGSSFKPLSALIPGIEEGVITAATIYDDTKTIFEKKYTPKNYNGYSTLRTIRNATTTSQNIPFIKAVAELGTSKSLEYLKKMGITTLDDVNDSGLPMVIGGLTNGVSPLEMAGAYASIANNGTYIEPTFYSKIEDSNGKIVLEPNQKTEKVCSEDTAYIVKDILTTVVTGAQGYAGTATYCKISGIDVAAKTGTTNGDVDRWLCGFTNYYAAATWFGYDEPEYVSFSGNPAGKIWDEVMTAIHKGLLESKFEKTANVVSAKICRASGRLATDRCTDTYYEIFVKGKLPETCDAHNKTYTVCSESGKLPNEYCPSDKLITKTEKYIVEKERLNLWNTLNITVKTGENPPTDYCTVHKKVEIIKPVEKPVEENPKQDENNTNGKDNSSSSEQKPNDNTGNINNNGNTETTGETQKPISTTNP